MEIVEEFVDFLNFLRGMETKKGHNFGHVGRVFLNFLRGMETTETACIPS